MAAYATGSHEFQPRGEHSLQGGLELVGSPASPPVDHGSRASAALPVRPELSVIDQLVDELAERIAGAVADRLVLRGDSAEEDDWFDSRRAAEYLDVHRDTLRKLAAERAIPSDQDGPGCKLYFRRSDLDQWRRSGGRPRHLALTAGRAA